MDTALATAAQTQDQGTTSKGETTSNQAADLGAGKGPEVKELGGEQGSVNTGVVSGDGTPKTWRDDLPADLKGEKSLESFKDVPGLAKSYVEAQKMIGGSIRIPDAKDEKRGEKMTEIYRKLGVPEKTEDYKLQKPIIAKGIELTDTEMKTFTEACHKANIAPEQAQTILNYYGETVKAAIPNYEADSKKCVESLKESWGPATERNMGVARRALYQVFGRQVASKVESTNLGNDVDFVKGMYNLGKTLVEEGVIDKEVAQGFGDEDARNELAKLATADVNVHPYFKADHPEHGAWVEKVMGWRRMLEA